MQFGLFSPSDRNSPVTSVCYDENLAEAIEADRVGYQEAWFAEHTGRPNF
ncbi:MAG: hypothetical protein HW416_953 [Chloroflexi bacterium]|nr:hypothetical protein [Chloroflexota bacterium]